MSLLRQLLAFSMLACSISLANAAPKVSSAVSSALASDGPVNVVIALKAPAAEPSGKADLARQSSQISSMQSSVLQNLAPGSFTPQIRYQSVPAMSGTITSTAAITALESDPNVIKVDLDVGGEGHLAQVVPLVKANKRHSAGNTGNGVVVAVFDSGLDTDHSDLADDLLAELCFADNDGVINGVGRCPNGSDRQVGAGSAEDDAGHGTHVTGIITSSGTISSAGVAPDAGIVAVRVSYGPSFAGSFYSFAELVAAMDYIISNPELGVQIINMSLGTFATFSGDCDTTYSWTIAGAAAVNTLRSQGVTVFASAGNSGSATDMSAPACLSNVIAVGASDDSDNPASFTNSNAGTDIFGPGVSVTSSAMGNSQVTASGTSMASPAAAACAALLLENDEVSTPDELEARLESSPTLISIAGSGLSFPRFDCAPDPCANGACSGWMRGWRHALPGASD